MKRERKFADFGESIAVYILVIARHRLRSSYNMDLDGLPLMRPPS